MGKTLDDVRAVKPAALDGSQAREITITLAGKPVAFKGRPTLVHLVLPNVYFHATVADAILRHNGVELGKRDVMGSVPGLNPA
jgi:hypothetical protein